MQQWILQQYHSIPFWDLGNIYRVLIAPNGHKFTICQVIMSTKFIQDHIFPLIISVDQSSKGNVIIIYDISIKEKAETLLSHFGIYLAVAFGSLAWEAFTVFYRTSMETFQYCPVKCCAVEIDASTIASDNSFDHDFAKCGFIGNQIEIPHKIEFDLPNHFSLNICANIRGIISDVNSNSGTSRSNVSDVTIATSQSILPKTIDYLTSIQKPPSSPTSTKQINTNSYNYQYN